MKGRVREMRSVTEEFFEADIFATGPLVLEFGAEWCAPCKRVAPLIEELSKEYKVVRKR